MSRGHKPFEQYRTLLPDGRSVVGVVAFRPVRLRLWVVAGSKRDALSRVRDFGIPAPHIESSFRPGQNVAELAASDPAGIVFVEDSFEFFPRSVLLSPQLAAFIYGTMRGR